MSVSRKMLGAERRHCGLFTPPFIIWQCIKRPRKRTCGIVAGGKGVGPQPS